MINFNIKYNLTFEDKIEIQKQLKNSSQELHYNVDMC